MLGLYIGKARTCNSRQFRDSPAGSCSGSESRLATAYVYRFHHDIIKHGLRGRIRTCGPSGPDRELYQTELRTEKRTNYWYASWDSNPQHLVFETSPTTNCGRGVKTLVRMERFELSRPWDTGF